MKALNQEAHENLRSKSSRRACRKRERHLSWIHEHLRITRTYSFNRVPFPEKCNHAERRGRTAMGQSWSLIAGMAKEHTLKGQRTCQKVRAC